MANIYDIDATELINKTAEKLKQIINPPEWSKFVKTSPAKERLPSQKDWYYKRAASILRTIYVRGPIGVEKLRIKYGAKKNRGHKPEKFYKASGSIIRKIIQGLEKAELISYKKDGIHKGRIITSKGKSFLDKLAK